MRRRGARGGSAPDSSSLLLATLQCGRGHSAERRTSRSTHRGAAASIDFLRLALATRRLLTTQA